MQPLYIGRWQSPLHSLIVKTEIKKISNGLHAVLEEKMSVTAWKWGSATAWKQGY